MKRRIPLLFGVASALAACTVGPDYRGPQTRVPGAFGELPADGAAAAGAQPVAAWWTTFHDPTLDSLIERAVRANPDLRGAQARVREARARLGVVSADSYPTLNATGDASRTRTSDHLFGVPGVTSNVFQAGFDASWELDVFGGVRRRIESADADVGAAVEDRRDVLVTLLAEVARAYVDLRGAQRQASIARENLAAQSQTLDLTRQRLTGGLATDLDVARSEAQVAATASAVPAFESEARRSIHALSVLVAAAPNALAAELSVEAPIPVSAPDVPAGLPSELLRRRPDVRRVERQLAAATGQIGVAVADRYPRFSLTGAVGLASDGLGNFVDAGSRTASIGGAASWSLFDFGRTRNAVDAAAAHEQAAAAAYESTVLVALRDVEDALVEIGAEGRRHVSLATAESASRRAAELASTLWSAGRTDFLSVLQAQRDLFVAQDALVQSDRRAAADVVALYKALGGGWEIEAAAGDQAPRGEAGARVFDVSGEKPQPHDDR